MKILLIEDERSIADAVEAILQDDNYEVDLAYDGLSGKELIVSVDYDLILLDIMLPGMDGYSILSFMRDRKITTPVICLTAKAEPGDIVKGLDLGADDYLTKPFDAGELLARIRARTRTGSNSTPDELCVGNIQLNQRSYILYGPEKTVKLGKTEFELLQYFMKHPGKILGREQIITKIWGYEYERDYNNLEVYVSFLRKKLKFLEADHIIKTHRRIGYSLENISDEEKAGQ